MLRKLYSQTNFRTASSRRYFQGFQTFNSNNRFLTQASSQFQSQPQVEYKEEFME